MEKEIKEVKDAVYVGMSVYDTLKNFIIESNGNIVSLEDKKYISLYLGILYANNDISKKLNKKNTIYKKLKYKNLTREELINTYNDGFVDILTQIDFTSIVNYFNFLLNNEFVNSINRSLRIDAPSSNKQLVR